jgi:hypothetical protein
MSHVATVWIRWRIPRGAQELFVPLMTVSDGRFLPVREQLYSLDKVYRDFLPVDSPLTIDLFSTSVLSDVSEPVQHFSTSDWLLYL